ncbi:VWA domain-containing protein, partial [Vibrio ponticus]
MSEFVFLFPTWLWTLLPLWALTAWLLNRSSNKGLIATHLNQALGKQNLNKKNGITKAFCLFGTLAIIALAGPSFSQAERPSFTNSSARVLVMDMSLSMYANDIKPNRMSQARYKAMDLLKLWADGQTGLVVYSADAYLVSPLTSDSNTLINLIPNLSPAIMPYQGANAAAGVELAIKTLTDAGFAKGDIVLFSDEISNDERQQIASLTSSGDWRLSILAIGTPAGAPIQLPDGSMLKSPNGATVVAQTEFANMRRLTNETGGVFAAVQANNTDISAITALTEKVSVTRANSAKDKINDRVNSGYWLVVILLLPTLLLFRRGVLLSVLVMVGAFGMSKPSYANPFINSDQQGYQLYENSDFSAAADVFKDQRWKGIAQYQNGDFEGAVKSLSQFDDLESQYNLANAHTQLGNFEQAKSLYQQVLEQKPDFQDAKENLKIVTQAEQQQQQQQNSQSGPNDSQEES